MSGGVDSSVTALLLKQQGHNVTGCFIKGWYPKNVDCEWRDDRRDAMRVCAKLDIPFITIDAEKEYKKDVVDYMISEYELGRTPNPDVMCNKNVKFGVFLKKALEMGADYIATGHYVKIRDGMLLQAKDKNKDQSYFLWALTQKQLKHCLFPLGNLSKPEVRELAKKFGLPTAQKKESMGVCFIGKFDMKDFLKKYIKSKKGKIVTDKGEVVGEHEGVVFYTIGQRHGFGGGGGTPYSIVKKDIKKNLLIVSDKKNEDKFFEKEIEIEKINWIGGIEPDLDKTYLARVRHRQPLQFCKIVNCKLIKNLKLKIKNCKVIFDEPQRAVASGQSLVLYDGQKMLGGGIIV